MFGETGCGLFKHLLGWGIFSVIYRVILRRNENDKDAEIIKNLPITGLKPWEIVIED